MAHSSLEERIAYLYAPERLEARFRTFEAVTLPALRAQTDPDFTLVVVIGDSLPRPHRDRLHDLLAGLSQAVVQARPPGPHRKVMQAAINAVRLQDGQPCLQFRLDDDDAVSRHFIARLRARAADARPLLDEHRHFAIDFCHGWIARPSAAGLAVRPTVEPLWTAALAVAFRPDLDLSVMNFGHSKLGRFMPVLEDRTPDMFVRGHDDWNDSRQKRGVAPVQLDPADDAARQIFAEAFAIDEATVRRIFRA